MTFISLSVSLWNDRADPVIDGVGLAGFKSRANAFSRPELIASFCLLMFSLSIFFLWDGIVGHGS